MWQYTLSYILYIELRLRRTSMFAINPLVDKFDLLELKVFMELDIVPKCHITHWMDGIYINVLLILLLVVILV